MKYKWAFCGACTAIGVALSPWLAVSLEVLIVIFGGVLLLLMIFRNELLLMPIFLLMGVIAVEQRENIVPEDGFLIGRVALISGREALVESIEGRVLMRFSNDVPKDDSWIAVRYQKSLPMAQIPGAPWSLLSAKRAGAVKRRAIQWSEIFPSEEQVLPEKMRSYRYGGLIWGFATGQRAYIKEEDQVLMRKTGTAHLLAISGMHIGVVAGFAAYFAKIVGVFLIRKNRGRIVPYLICLSAIIAAYLYAKKVGWPSSAQRAFWMVFFASLAHCSGRKIEVWNVLGAAAIFILLEEPAQFNTLGFKFSFSAVIGILLLTRRFTRLVPPDAIKPIKWIISAFGAGVGAALGTLPWSALYFQQFSWVSPLTNLIAAPLMGGIAVPLALIGVLLPQNCSGIFLLLSDWVIGLTFFLLKPFDFDLLNPAVGPVEACILFFTLWLRKKELWMLLIYLIVLGPLPRKNNHLRVTFLDVGQGDCALIRWPDNRNWLIDGGISPRQLIRYLRRENINELDLMVLSHPHQDHMAGLKGVSEELTVKEVLTVRAPIVGETAYKELWHEWIEQGVSIALPQDVSAKGLKILHPLDGWKASGTDWINEESLVFEVDYESRTILFTGDIEEDAERYLIPKLTSSDIVKVPHHGSKSSSSENFVQVTDAIWAVISCGRRNRFGHPNVDVLHRWRDVHMFRTDELGTIEFWIGDSTVEVRAWEEETGWKWVFKDNIE